MPYKDNAKNIESATRWAKKHPDRVSEYKRQYVKRNPEKVRGQKRDYYYRNLEESQTRSREIKRKDFKDGKTIQNWLIKQYKLVPCMDCNSIFLFCAMDFDHRPEEVKSFCVSRYNRCLATEEKIAFVQKEIDKCDFVCACCHRVRTWNRRNHASLP